MKKTVVITGSGVSSQYGFPTGKQLIDQILGRLPSGSSTLSSKNKGNYIFGYNSVEELDRLLTSFNFSSFEKDKLLLTATRIINGRPVQQQSFNLTNVEFIKEFKEGLLLFKNSQIDYFLRNRSKFRELGQLLITKIILDAEKDAFKRMTENHGPEKNWTDNNWLGCLTAKIFEKSRKPEDLKKISENLTVITFNYDTSLEYYLDLVCKGDGEWGKAIQDFKQNLKIIHVYGKVGTFDWESESNLKEIYDPEMIEEFFIRSSKNGFGKVNDFDTSYEISKGIKVIDSIKNSNDLKHIKLAREKIREADQVFFLGFGFDSNNLDYLGLNGTGHTVYFGKKDVFYTCREDSERIKLVIEEKKIKDVRHNKNGQDVYNDIKVASEAKDLIKIHL